MKFQSVLCLFFACLILTALPALQSTLVIDDATPNQVHGTVTMYNDTASPVEWTFGDTNWIDLFIDGNHTHFGGVTIMINVTIPAAETLIEHIAYEGPPALAAGTHSAQARIRWGTDWAPITTPINFDLHSAFDDFNFAYQVQFAHPDSIAVMLTITNSGTSEITYNFA
ncbi:MAG TPA: hypothetical protein PKK33_10055, partial [Candidatus Cloacimonadota bacterium]|nr:hypothetical protein [Candidatus Cloacimonadota bacterium]